MSRPSFSSLNRALLSLCGLSHSFSFSSSSAASNRRLDFLFQEAQVLEPLKRVAAPSAARNLEEKEVKVRSVEISHPWPEWVELMDHLLKSGYLDRDAFQSSSSNFNSSKDSNLIRTGCLTFARESSELIRKDIRIVVGYGCPSSDRKVVNSGKRLRAYVGTNEGEVCSSCKLRGNCERAYVKPNEDEAGRTLDVMRILLTYGIDANNASEGKNSRLNLALNESIRKLLKDVVNLSIKGYGSVPEDERHRMASSRGIERPQNSVPMKQGDWVCPKCNFLNFAKNIKCLRCDGLFRERLAKLCEDGENLPLKKGDWICEKCNFLNFAKNAKCLQCNEKPTNRLLNPGEWECASCNYINFRKNYYCLKCGWKRPKAACVGDGSAESNMNNNKEQHSKSSDSTFQRFLHEKNHIKEGSSKFQSLTKYSFCEYSGIDEDDERNESKSSTEFHEFPIVGGKSPISKDQFMRERWKEEMRSKGVVQRESCRKNDHEISSASIPENTAANDSGDEEDIAGWFRE
ncbi:zinc finger protein VAR3, chloroplastic-like isoform X2 [Phalaenopsis equestris]|uniref:zinc finger protein VAR3, chloroplastic-like isoform X2 n=1 Tax=Phalaenopsis equestris TaxID=78828 RepID=UPI0009E60AA7|nr:zinc finger protein VAR3, chloroplastic-like isoform X2 [Phalaenopsis equestris]